MKDYYFPHDYHASQDEKIIKLLKTMGWEGYGIYWGIVERLHKEGGWLTKDFEALSFDMRTHSERIANAVLDFNLFIFDGNKFTTQRVLDNITKQQEKSDKARQSAQLSWLHRDRKHANAMPVQSERNAIKERKGKERKENISNTIPPTVEDVKSYCVERNNSIDPQHFIDYYQTRGWAIGKNKVKDWKACIRTWEKRNSSKLSGIEQLEKEWANEEK